ncbi:hypothetical protein TCAL_05139 [Tigriopus californicus]|uniref:RUN domain-containing protein n=1 Tax=Tigriopus californicus TaxID=6832 RepID=A0A553NBU7_TIGCA|nr:uncharacterized protein LOC131888345 [Tigriopus californicus]TRY62922.1 hypothetical protein TCAL_05139 [Tigriopus californicus]|eukprot:TCALIF_05139-PA protein Name:"Similar to PLEKHM3 Pleckstrin homology domain-containing family M member 3 (Homo sapiens)" AED:0.14 eAED:0.15 QI:0/-1/0/1/-1/1/1/0/803
MAQARPGTPSPLSTASTSPDWSSAEVASLATTGNLATDCLLRAKRTIKRQLIDAIKDLQVDHPVGGRAQRVVIGNKEDASRLCHALEALLLHGLKRQSFFGKLNQVLLGPKMGKKLPETHFWHFILIFSHQSTLATLNGLKLIKTDIGRCRAWVRHALNEGLLQGYLQSMQKDKVTCAKHYENTAFVRDPECFELATRYLLGLECYKFELATNSSLLNNWQTPSLVMAGLWIPDNFQDEAPAPAEDVLALMAEEAVEVEPPAAPITFDIRAMGLNGEHSYFQRGLLNETEAMKMIMAINDPTPPSSSRNSSPLWAGATAEERRQSFHNLFRNPHSASQSLPKSYQIPPTPPEAHPPPAPLADSGDSQDGLAMPDDQDTKSCVSDSIYNTNSAMYRDTDHQVADDSPQTLDENIEYIIEDMRRADLSRSNTSTETCPTPVRRRNNGQIIASSLPMSENETTILLKTVVKHVQRVNVTSPRLSGFIESFNAFGSERYFDTGIIPATDNYETMGFQLKKGVSVGGLTVSSSQYLMSLFDQLTRIRGLGHAKFQCFKCQKAVGPLFGPAEVCHYTSQYYCDDCHFGETSLIPAKVVYNWDFTKFKVCREAKIFLKAMFIEPIIDVKTFNASLLEFAPELDEVYILRKRLHYVHAYLATCREVKVKDKFVNILSPRQYLFDDVDKYSLQDLEQVKSGQMAKLLKQALQLGESHVLKCVLCSQKGFICEVCKTPKPIYPFHLEEISQCQQCFTVFHSDCSEKLDNCPKCERMSARNLNWHVTNCRLNRAVFEPEYLDGEDGLGAPKNAH